jgi:hypothetical protein
MQAKQYGVAEAAIQRAINGTVDSEKNAKGNWQLGGMGAGALAGTLVFPGVGTVIGALAGRMLGEKVGETEAPAAVAWRRSDLLFSLGMLYTLTGRGAEAGRCWIQALTLNENHEPSKLALAGGL